MKKLFTMIAVCAATFTASAGTIPTGTLTAQKSTSHPTYPSGGASLRSISCDTITNLNFATGDSVGSYYNIPAGYGEGYLTGNGSLNFGSGYLPITGIAEKFDAPAGFTNPYVDAAVAFFAKVDINPGDSNVLITAYVIDTTGAGAYGGYGPGNAVDSATITLGNIARYSAGLWSFTNQAPLVGKGFFIAIALPQVTGDTLVLITNSGGGVDSTGHGNGWLNIPSNGGWTSYDSLAGLTIGNYIYAGVCGTAAPSCPTITVTATEIANTNSADASASGGAAPYTYSWSNAELGDTATNLTNGQSYTVTATDHNGCTGTATASISTGIASVGNIAGFNIYPNPSTGSFTASVHLASASDVSLSITDLTGTKVYESTDVNAKDINKNINLGTIAAGIYIASIKTAEGTANQRIVIK